jgi:hypothetical protein
MVVQLDLSSPFATFLSVRRPDFSIGERREATPAWDMGSSLRIRPRLPKSSLLKLTNPFRYREMDQSFGASLAYPMATTAPSRR